MDAFPAFFPLRDRLVVIAGDGEPADAKARLFEGSPARVRRLGRDEGLDPSAYQGAHLIFVASFDSAWARAAAAAARAACPSGGAPLNVVDQPDLCDFTSPSVIDRGRLVIGIGTSGAAPVMASWLRARLEALLPPGLGPLADLFGARREAIVNAFPDMARRRAFFREMLTGEAARAADLGDVDAASRALDAALARDVAAAAGRIALVEVPSDLERLSLRAVQALSAADLVAADEGGEAAVTRFARRDAARGGLSQAGELVQATQDGLIVTVAAAKEPEAHAGALRERGARVDLIRPAPAIEQP
ncbi:MAG: bifunctional precorrin-2 dehydrogenase/sirohydrochlorin ferrochelatase [Alphaproteobacteria bacterium]|nr:bifunctional precorrin-2 dehydrogenase/sirohydrochlorin ferrochelatase [Alphaproteobacteria bacterium]